MNSSLKIIGLLACMLCLAGMSSAQVNLKKQEALENRDKAEQKTRPFNPAYFNNQQAKHIALIFKVNDNQELEPARGQVRSSNMPHRSTSSGQVTISYLDQEGKLLGKYSMYDPLLVRSFEGKEPNLQPPPPGTLVEILVPYQPNIARLNILTWVDKEQKQVTLDVRKIVIEAIEKDRGN